MEAVQFRTKFVFVRFTQDNVRPMRLKTIACEIDARSIVCVLLLVGLGFHIYGKGRLRLTKMSAHFTTFVGLP